MKIIKDLYTIRLLACVGIITTLFISFSISTCLAQHLSEENVPEATGWKKTTIVNGLEHPWGLAFLPDGDALITERPGRIRLLRNGRLLDESIAGVPEVFVANQGGMFDIATDPEFASNRLIYFSYASGSSESNQTRVARARLNDMQLSDLEILFKAEPAKPQGQHFGARMLWLPDNSMLVSIGDGGNPPLEIDGILAREHAQRLDTHPGSLIRLNPDGSVPEDNPFFNHNNAKPEIYSYGHRNIQGLAYDPETSRIWANEHGPSGGDELNLIEAGANYGWPEQTHGRDYRTGQRFAPARVEGMVDPKLVWTPAQAPSGLAFYTGEHFPDWQGSLFSGGLRGQQIRRVILDGEEVKSEERLSINERVREVTQGPDGYLYILTDSPRGKLLRIEPLKSS